VNESNLGYLVMRASISSLFAGVSKVDSTSSERISAH
jgi:hypothetical protein